MNKTVYHTLALSYGAYFNTLALFSQSHAAKKAFQLFSTPRKGKVLPHQEQFLNNAKDKTVLINGLDLQTYQWEGQNDTVLLMHGWESNAFRWRNLIEKLQEEKFNVIAFDAPGHGYSNGNLLNLATYSDSARQLIQMYQPKHIIGHSMGGLATIHHQYQNPDTSIQKIVALGAPAELTELMEHYQNLLKFNDSVLEGLDKYLYENYNFWIKDISTPKFARSISKPGLIVHDKEDIITPFSASERLHKNWKNSQLIATTGLGHSLHQDEVNRKIAKFLSS
ncbi:Putative aminoacrylate hydrolase RutD [Arenibacter antarcticus]|uniref:Alpha/beta fold hydrolase n=1 Tax=Arenibacter antarcticus TaxID=2040469 RepID=A0ABW5VD10_9FLAO|nr:alpha/beta hydrolase [Arenibacter sp. H213]MCM4168559.1 alpha/beta hydrolase [Arenibacter sp. H213]